MDRDQQQPATPGAPDEPKHPEGRDNKPKLGRETPGEGLDTGVDTGAIQPGQTSNARPTP